METAQIAWTGVLDAIQRKGGGTLDLWLGQVNCVGIEDDHLLLKVPNAFARDWIKEHYMPAIVDALQEVVPGKLVVDFLLDSSAFAAARRETAEKASARPSRPPPAPNTATVNPRFTFESFVEGPSNQLALSACRSVAAGTEGAPSPVFIFSPSGLGKTHLLSAIHHATQGVTSRGPVLYLPAETFMNEFVECVQQGRMKDFRERYRKDCGLLLLDDIQFLGSRERTQEEFFHLFNELYNTGRPVVMSSDRPPRDIPKIEERLRSRFEWGLVADIGMPELETRMAIARRKAQEMGLNLPPEVLDLVAENARGSVREIEGALIRLDVQSGLSSGGVMDPESARRALGIVGAGRTRKSSADDVMRQVAAVWGVKVSDIKGERRHRSVALPRQVAMHLCRQVLRMSYPEIGERFGGRDHTTVMNACKKIGALLESDAEMAAAVESLRRTLEG